MRKKGSILIETIVSIGIIMTMFLIVTMFISENLFISKRRKEIEEGNRIVYCLMQEIKYNITFQEILNDENERVITLKKYDDILNDLMKSDICDLPLGEDIKIYAKLNEDKIDVEILLNDKLGDCLAEKSFVKYKWMDYYE